MLQVLSLVNHETFSFVLSCITQRTMEQMSSTETFSAALKNSV